VLGQNERIGHARNVIADDAGRVLLRFLAVGRGQIAGPPHPVGEEFADDALGFFFFGFQSFAEIKVVLEEFLAEMRSRQTGIEAA